MFAQFWSGGIVEVGAAAHGDPDHNTEFVSRDVCTRPKHLFAGTGLGGEWADGLYSGFDPGHADPVGQVTAVLVLGLVLVAIYVLVQLGVLAFSRFRPSCLALLASLPAAAPEFAHGAAVRVRKLRWQSCDAAIGSPYGWAAP